jgi:hypothetical protein
MAWSGVSATVLAGGGFAHEGGDRHNSCISAGLWEIKQELTALRRLLR